MRSIDKSRDCQCAVRTKLHHLKRKRKKWVSGAHKKHLVRSRHKNHSARFRHKNHLIRFRHKKHLARFRENLWFIYIDVIGLMLSNNGAEGFTLEYRR